MSSNWTHKINSAETPPPARVWDNIAASLDESFNGNKFPIELYNLESDPPANTWNKIQNELAREESPVIPIQRKNTIPLVFRYAIAACLIGLISFAAIKFFSINTAGIEVAVKDSIIAPDNTKTNAVTTVQAAQTPAVTDEEALEQSKQTYARLDLSHRSIAGKADRKLYNSPALLASSQSSATLPDKNPELQYSHRAAVNDSPNDKDTDRYLMYKDEEGRFIRISKKLSAMLCCVNGEEQDDKCTDQLKKWRQKIAGSSFIPSPDNFMDILDLVNSLQDNYN